MKHIICLFWTLVLLLPVVAAPFDQKFTLPQPDGSQIELRGEGDEFYSVHETLDGYTVVLDTKTGFYHYAELSPDGEKLLPAGPRVVDAVSLDLEMPKHLRISDEARARQILEGREIWNKEAHGWREMLKEFHDSPLALASVESDTETSPQPQSQPIAPTSIVALTILVDFSDAPATVPTTTIDGLLNSPSGNSVRKYYSDNSNGLVTYTNILTPYVRVARTKADYALIGNSSHNLKIDAINALKALPNYQTEILPTFSSLTKLSNNHIFCNIFYAGGTGPMGAQMGYAAEQDLGGNLVASGFTVQPIGDGTRMNTFAHESGHLVFGFPDLYDYNPTYKGAGVFCLMSSGTNLNPPAQICAYLKARAGWATVTDITPGSFLTATVGTQGSAEFNHFYRYRRPGSDTEYFIIENRQKQGQDAALYGQGVLIWHIDELGNNSRPNLLPNSTHNNYEASLEQADNLFHLQNAGNNWGDANDPYYNGNPAAAYTGIFDDFSSPSANWWDGTPSGIHLRDFSVNGTEMTFQVGNPEPYVIGKDAMLVREGYAPANNVIDPGETVTVRFNVRNAGFSASSNAVVTLLAQGGVVSPSGPQSLGVLAAQADGHVDFTFTADVALGESLTTTIQIEESPKVYGSFSNSFIIGEMGNSFWTQDFDSVSAPNLPSGWTTSASNGTAALWKTSTAARDSLPNSAFVAEGGGNDSTVALISPVVAIAHSSTQLRFRHNYNTERDEVGINGGGVLEIKIGSDPWQDVIAAGGSWATNGYNVQNLDASYGNPLGFRSAWGGNSGGFITTLVNLPPSVGGKNVQFRWLYGYDSWAPWGGSVGWYVDTISLIGPIGVTPVLEVTPRNHDFGSTAVGQTKNISFTATNTGAQSISGTISVPSPFSIVGSTSFNLGAGQSTTVNVNFSPQAAGNDSASLVFTSAGIITVSPILSGSGEDDNIVEVTQWPTATGIVYGQALSVSTLSGGTASVPGTFAFTVPATIPDAGTYSAAVTFTPTDPALGTVSGTANVAVAKANPVITALPTASDINYGQYFSASSLSGGTASTAGTFAFSGAAVGFTGQDAFTFRVSNGTLVSEAATVSLTINSSESLPAATPTAHAAPPATSTRSDGYTVVTFTENEAWTVPAGVTAVEVLVVGGGGGGGASISFSNAGGGGGGAGGLIHIPEYAVTSGNAIQVTVGAGGAPGTTGNNPGTNGQNSVFGELVALGGGGGSGGNMVGLAGGSGGGSRINSAVGGTGQQPSQPGLSGQYGFGRNGGAVNEAPGASAGGGGGAGAAGSGITGGNGRSVSITGTSVAYAGGGGGGGAQGNTPGNGGTGGGGKGANDGTAAIAGSPNTGGGGGGGNNNRSGAQGGSGIVIVAYNGSNQPPVANAQSVTIQSTSPTAITLTGSDPNNDPLTFEIVTQPTHGTLSGTAPNVTYTPPIVPEPGVHPVAIVFTPADTANYNSVSSTVDVTVLGGISPYDAWAGPSGHNLIGGSDDDDDGDGFSNFHEFAFGMNPTVADIAKPVTMERAGNNLLVRYQRTAGSELSYTVWASNDLVEWIPQNVTSNQVVETSGTGAEIIEATVSDPLTGPALFLRVSAE